MIRQPRVQRVAMATAVATPIDVRPQTVAGSCAYRAAAKVSTGTESRRQHFGKIRPPVRPGRNGAEGGRGAGSYDSQGFAKHHARMTEPRLVGTPISLTCKARPAAPPAIVAPGSPAARLAARRSQRVAALHDLEVGRNLDRPINRAVHGTVLPVHVVHPFDRLADFFGRLKGVGGVNAA